jgi:hypothetical protein
MRLPRLPHGAATRPGTASEEYVRVAAQRQDTPMDWMHAAVLFKGVFILPTFTYPKTCLKGYEHSYSKSKHPESEADDASHFPHLLIQIS